MNIVPVVASIVPPFWSMYPNIQFPLALLPPSVPPVSSSPLFAAEAVIVSLPVFGLKVPLVIVRSCPISVLPSQSTVLPLVIVRS